MLWHSYLLWLRTDCIDLSAAFAYHTLQSFLPALLIGLSLASLWLGRDRDLLEQLLHRIGQIIPISFQPVVEETLTRFLRQGVGAGLLGFLLLAFSANNIYLSLQRGADRLWWNRPLDIESLTARQVVVRFITLRLKALLLLLFVGPLIVLDQWISNIRFLGFREPLGNEPRKRALSRNLCCMNNLESHLRLVGLISPYLKLNLAYVVLFFPSMGTLFPRSRTA
jgi:membrane protein